MIDQPNHFSTTLTIPSLKTLTNLCGANHENIVFIENKLCVRIQVNSNDLMILGHEKTSVDIAKDFLNQLLLKAHAPITREIINTTYNQLSMNQSMFQSIVLNRKTIAPRNTKQSEYLKSMQTYDLTFAAGPAGTGKTFLAVAKAIELFEKGEIHRMVFVRPAVEAGEKLGFLPGDLVEKVLPYLRPIYDALYDMIGFKDAQKLLSSEVIEILPLAFMRGRTLNDAFIILDEAQNTTPLQMKMFLTRIGYGSKAVVTGDTTQVDLPKGTISGLGHAIDKLKSLKNDIGIHTFTSLEVVRHPLVAKIIDSYENE